MTIPIELEGEVARHNAALVAEAAQARLAAAAWARGPRTWALAARLAALAARRRPAVPCCQTTSAARPACCPA